MSWQRETGAVSWASAARVGLGSTSGSSERARRPGGTGRAGPAVRRAWPTYPGRRHARQTPVGGSHGGGLRSRPPPSRLEASAAAEHRRRGVRVRAGRRRVGQSRGASELGRVTHLQARPSLAALVEAAGAPAWTRRARRQGAPAAGSASSRRARGGTPFPPPAWGTRRRCHSAPCLGQGSPGCFWGYHSCPLGKKGANIWPSAFPSVK